MNTQKFNPFPVLMTQRLSLRRLVENDRELVFLLRSDDRVNFFINRAKPNSIADALEFITARNKNADEGVSIQWAISLKGSPDLIGTVCLWNFSSDEKTAELGYELHPDFHGKGLMNEAAGVVIKYGSDSLHLNNIEAFTHRDNNRSTKLLKKNGFKLIPGRYDEDNSFNAVYVLDI